VSQVIVAAVCWLTPCCKYTLLTKCSLKRKSTSTGVEQCLTAAWQQHLSSLALTDKRQQWTMVVHLHVPGHVRKWLVRAAACTLGYWHMPLAAAVSVWGYGCRGRPKALACCYLYLMDRPDGSRAVFSCSAAAWRPRRACPLCIMAHHEFCCAAVTLSDEELALGAKHPRRPEHASKTTDMWTIYDLCGHHGSNRRTRFALSIRAIFCTFVYHYGHEGHRTLMHH
jgi:hypothetical protein